MSREKVDLLKRTVAKDADDDQLALFLHTCNRHGLDPFAKQVYAIFYNNDKSKRGEGPKDMAIVTGIDGYRKMAARDHRDFAGTSSAAFEWFDPPRFTPEPLKRRIPESATVRVYRKGGPVEGIPVTVYWEEYAPKDLSDYRADFWRRMPKNMLEKCAEAKALRKEFPGLGDVYIPEELAQRNETQTDGGREITDEKGFNVHGQPMTFEAKQEFQRTQAKQIAEKKTTELRQKVEDAKPAAAKPVTRRVELDKSDPADPIIRGDLAEILALLQDKCPSMEWRGDWWHIAPEDLDTVLTIIDLCNERIPQPAERFKVVTVQPPAATKQPPKKKRGAGEPAERTLVAGVLIRCDAAMVREGTTPTRQVKINASFYPCYRNTLFPFLDKATGKNVEVWTDKRHQIIGLKKVAAIEFDEDGVTPFAPLNREPGSLPFDR